MMEEGIFFHLLVILIASLLFLAPVIGSSTGDKRLEQTQPGVKPDVTITDLTFSIDEPEEGDMISISVTIRNNESSDLENLNIRLLRLEENITDRDISIGAEDENTYDFEWRAEGGDQVITAILSMNNPESEGKAPLDDMTREIHVEPDPLGDVYTPILALAFIFLVVFGSVLIPSIISAITNRSDLEEKER